MMIAPATFRQEHLSDSLEKCYEVRKSLMMDLISFESGLISEEKKFIKPSPETKYNMKNLYLIEICKLIEEKRLNTEKQD